MHISLTVAQRLKCPPPMRETWVWSLGWEDPLMKEMATHSIILAGRIPWMEEPGRLQSTGLQRVGHDWATSLSFLLEHSLALHFFGIGMKAITKLDSIFKSREITLPTKFHIVKAMVFPVVMFRCAWKCVWSRSVVSDSLWPRGL